VVLVSKRPHLIQNILNNYNQQTYKNKELIIIFNCDSIPTFDSKIHFIQIDSTKSLGFCFNYGIEKANGDYIAKMDDDDYYGPEYLKDTYNITKLTNATVTGKKTYFIHYENNLYLRRFSYFKNNKLDQFTDFVCGATFFINKNDIMKHNIKFQDLDRGEDTQFLKDIKKANLKIYCDTIFNYCYIRYTSHNHTWNVSKSELLKDTILVNDSFSKEIIDSTQNSF
jgi:glycosyltransferase involved in cell wall biosynthesis